MGCAASQHVKKRPSIYPKVSNKAVSLPVSDAHKNILRASWKSLEEEKYVFGRNIFVRLLQLNPDLQDTFPSFKGVSLDELMNSRSLFLHSKRLMGAVENAISSLDDGQDFIDYLKSLGERHSAITITEKHFKVMEKALILALKDILGEDCTEEVSNAWGDLFQFMTGTMMAGKEQAKENQNLL